MTRLLVLVSGTLLCAGCFTSSREPAKSWSVEPCVTVPADPAAREGKSPAFAATRIGTVAVCAPFDRTSFVVRRADGSVAFDAYNEFAAAPSALLRAPIRSQLASDGRFGRVVAPASTASADAAVEVLVTDLSLDCRAGDKRTARAAVCIDVVQTGRGPRAVALSGDGEGEADAAAGDYSAAFSAAFNAAVSAALRTMK